MTLTINVTVTVPANVIVTEPVPLTKKLIIFILLTVPEL